MTANRLRSRLVGALATAALALTVAGVGAAPASAHSQITDISPANGSVLDVPPAEVRFTFDAPLLKDTDTISINDLNGNVVKSVHPPVEGNSVAIAWPAGTKPGSYQVAYRIVCGDGHPEVGAITLTVNSAGPATAASAPGEVSSSASAAAVVAADEAPPADGSSGSLVPMIVGVAILLTGAVALVAAILARRRGAATPSAPDATVSAR